MTSIRRFLFSGPGGATAFADLGLLLFRVFIGLALAFGHGIGKLPPSERFIAGVAEMGFPAATFFGWASGFAEFGGGLLIVLGLLTRPAALLVAINLSVVVFIRQAGDPFRAQELAMLYLAAAAMLLFTGAGRYSLDEALRKSRE